MVDFGHVRKMQKFQTCVCREEANELSRGAGITRNVRSGLGGCDCVGERPLPVVWLLEDGGRGEGRWACDRHVR